MLDKIKVMLDLFRELPTFSRSRERDIENLLSIDGLPRPTRRVLKNERLGEGLRKLLGRRLGHRGNQRIFEIIEASELTLKDFERAREYWNTDEKGELVVSIGPLDRCAYLLMRGNALLACIAMGFTLLILVIGTIAAIFSTDVQGDPWVLFFCLYSFYSLLFLLALVVSQLLNTPYLAAIKIRRCID